MSEISSELVVRISFDGNIELVADEKVSGADWQKCIAWWAGVSLPSESKRIIKVSVPNFEARKNWLRDYWTDIGKSVSVNPGVKEVLMNAKNDLEEFETLAYSHWEPTSNEIASFNPELTRPMTDSQIRNVLGLLRMPNGANFSVPGAGKTATELVLWSELKRKNPNLKVLVVCPRSAFESWITEPAEVFKDRTDVRLFDSGFISYETQILVTNYEQLENFEKLTRLKNWMIENTVLLVIDEAHRIKGGSASVRWRACKQLSDVAFRTDLLTGTPLPQGLDDLRNLLSLSWKNIPVGAFTSTNLLRVKRGGIFVRTTKSELALPPVTIKEVTLPMGDIQQEIYSALRNSFGSTFLSSPSDELYFERRGKAVFTLIAAATNPGLLMNRVNEDSYLNLTWPPREIIQNLNLTKVVNEYVQHEIPPKYIWLTNMLKDRANRNEKVIVWSNFVGNLQAMERLLSPFNPVLIHGSTSIDDRKVLLKKFRESDSSHVLLTNPQTLGEGISLHQVCHESVYVDRSYNAGHYLQSLDRIHRLGLPNDQKTVIHILVSERSIDERVQNRLSRKIDLLGQIMNDQNLVAGCLPNDLEESGLNIAGLDSADIADLMSHLKSNTS
jgi:SNF2 family DNA or RNA helicase